MRKNLILVKDSFSVIDQSEEGQNYSDWLAVAQWIIPNYLSNSSTVITQWLGTGFLKIASETNWNFFQKKTTRDAVMRTNRPVCGSTLVCGSRFTVHSDLRLVKAKLKHLASAKLLFLLLWTLPSARWMHYCHLLGSCFLLLKYLIHKL